MINSQKDDPLAVDTLSLHTDICNKSSINLVQTKSFTWAELGSDYKLAMTFIRLKLKKPKGREFPQDKFQLGKV